MTVTSGAGGTGGADGTGGAGGAGTGLPAGALPGRHVSEYFRLERWEVPPPEGAPGPSVLRGRAPVDDHQRGPGGGLTLGGLLSVVDSLGGFACGLAVLPRWIVSSSLAVRLARLDHRGPLELEATVLRSGRASAVCEVAVRDGGAGGCDVASALVTCAALDPGDLPLRFARPVVVPMPPADPSAPGPEEFFHIDPGTGPVTRMQMEDRLRNPWGILHGGAVAALADVAAARAVAGVEGGAVASADTVLRYLAPARVGPVEARCRIVGARPEGTVVRVAVHDLGAGGRPVALASVSVRHLGPRSAR